MLVSDILSELLLEDDPKAFELLFKVYYDKLFHVAKNYVQNEQDAEEIVQDTFMKIWRRRKKKETWTSGYLFMMIKNACLDYLRHQRVEQKRSKLFHEQHLSDPLRFIHSDAASQLMEQELAWRIEEILTSLPDMRKLVFFKSRMEGKKSSDIAVELGISKRTVEKHIHLALKQMRTQLKDFLA